jgi:hypothetical protein
MVLWQGKALRCRRRAAENRLRPVWVMKKQEHFAPQGAAQPAEKRAQESKAFLSVLIIAWTFFKNQYGCSES